LERLGLAKAPHRTTLSYRFKRRPLGLCKQLHGLQVEFVTQGVTVVDALSADSSPLHAEGKVWRKKQRDKGDHAQQHRLG
jgi:hypothetical protein